YDKEGCMQFLHSGDAPVYAPNSYGRAYQDEQGPVENGWEADGEMVRATYTLHADDSDFIQPGILVREVFDDAQRDQFVETVSGSLATVEEPVLSKALRYWKNVDTTIGERIELAVNTSKGDEQPGGDPLDAGPAAPGRAGRPHRPGPPAGADPRAGAAPEVRDLPGTA